MSKLSKIAVIIAVTVSLIATLIVGLSGLVSAGGDQDHYSLSMGWYDLNPADDTTYYAGYWPRAPVTVATVRSIPIPVNGTITVADIWTFATGAVGTNEDISIYIRVNNATDYLIATVGLANRTRRFTNTNMSIAVSVGDLIELKIVCPTWATNPTTWYASGVVIIDTSRATPSPTMSPTPTAVLTATPTPSPTPTVTATVSPTPTPTAVTTGEPGECWNYSQTVNIVGSSDTILDSYVLPFRVSYDLGIGRILKSGYSEEVSSYAIVDDCLYWADNYKSNTGHIFRTNLTNMSTDILYTSDWFLAQWQGLEVNGTVYAFGQEWITPRLMSAVSVINTSTGDVDVYHNTSTADCNEFIGVDTNGSFFFVGERGIGGDTGGSSWPNGGGFWSIPIDTVDDHTTWNRTYADSVGREWGSVAWVNGTVYGMLYAFASGNWTVISSDEDDLVSWDTELDYTAQTTSYLAVPHLVKCEDTLVALAAVETTDTVHAFILDGTWDDVDLNIDTSGYPSSPKFASINGLWLDNLLVILIGNRSSLTTDVYTLDLDTLALETIYTELAVDCVYLGQSNHSVYNLYNDGIFTPTITDVLVAPGGNYSGGEILMVSNSSVLNSITVHEHSQLDFSDIRFRNSAGNDLSYWMDTNSSGQFADFWVKVEDIPLYPNSTNVSVYYGSSNATSLSNGDDTFLFFDDFSGGMSKWNAVSGSWNIVDGQLHAASGADSGVISKDSLVVPSLGYILSMSVLTDYGVRAYLHLNNSSIYGIPNVEGITSLAYNPRGASWPYNNGVGRWRFSGIEVREISSTFCEGNSSFSKYSDGNQTLTLWLKGLKSIVDDWTLYPVDFGETRYVTLVSGWRGDTAESYFDYVWVANATINEPLCFVWTDEVREGCPGCPFDLTATSSGGNEAYLTWQSTPYVTAYMVRMRTDYYPVNVSDGQLVYYGINNSCTVSGLAMDLSTYYFRVWSEDWGVYSDCYSENTVGGVIVLFGIVGVFALALTWFSSRRPEILLRLVASIMWLALMFWIILGNTGFVLTDVWTGLIATACGVMAFVPWYWQMQTAIIYTKGNRSWTEMGNPPTMTSNRRQEHAKRLNRITKARRRRQSRWQF